MGGYYNYIFDHEYNYIFDHEYFDHEYYDLHDHDHEHPRPKLVCIYYLRLGIYRSKYRN